MLLHFMKYAFCHYRRGAFMSPLKLHQCIESKKRNKLCGFPSCFPVLTRGHVVPFRKHEAKAERRGGGPPAGVHAPLSALSAACSPFS